MFKPFVSLVLCLLLLPLPAAPVRAYTSAFNNSANVPLRWGTNTVNIALSSSLANPPANIRASGADVVAAARRALASWEAAANIRFNVVDNHPNQSVGQDGVSLITVADTAQNRSYIGIDALGRTNRVFDPSTGIIAESDVVLNPIKLFSIDGTPATADPNNRVYDLETTFAHEIGHLLGLGHSALIGATMNATQGENPTYELPATTGRSLSEDDIAGVRSIYGAPQGTSVIAGVVTRGGVPVFGAHVWAEDATSGRIAAGNVTLSNGSYRIGGVAPGTYNLKVEALRNDLDPATSSDLIASFRGIRVGSTAYASLAAASFQALDAGQVVTQGNATATRDVALGGAGVSLNPTRLGVRNAAGGFAASTFAVPFAPGVTRRVYVFGPGMTSVEASGVSVASPYFSIANFGKGVTSIGEGLAIDVTASASAPGGEYSIRLQAPSGEVAYVPGALTIEPRSGGTNPAVAQAELRTWTVPQGRAVRAGTEVYVRLTLPDSSYRVASWGVVAQMGTQFTVEATIERVAATAAVPVTTAYAYNLGALPASGYTFAFRSNLTAPQSIAVGGAASADPNPIDAAETFARQQYRDFLSREPDAPGLSYWTSQLTSCGADAACLDRQREGVSASFFLSQEFQATGYYVYRLYRAGLGRAPYYAEFLPEVRQVSAGAVVDNRLSPEVIDANKRSFALAFVGRDDFRQAYPAGIAGAAFVDALVARTGVGLTSAERQALIADYDAGAGTADERRARVLYAVADGTRSVRSATNPVDVDQVFETRYGRAFYDAQYNRAFVLMEYFGYLKRDPDAEGYAYWLEKLTRLGDYRSAEMVKAFLVSAEYRARFGQP